MNDKMPKIYREIVSWAFIVALIVIMGAMLIGPLAALLITHEWRWLLMYPLYFIALLMFSCLVTGSEDDKQ